MCMAWREMDDSDIAEFVANPTVTEERFTSAIEGVANLTSGDAGALKRATTADDIDEFELAERTARYFRQAADELAAVLKVRAAWRARAGG